MAHQEQAHVLHGQLRHVREDGGGEGDGADNKYMKTQHGMKHVNEFIACGAFQNIIYEYFRLAYYGTCSHFIVL